MFGLISRREKGSGYSIRVLGVVGLILSLGVIACSKIDMAKTMKINGKICYSDNHKPVTGIVVEYYENGHKKSSGTYWQGLAHGPSSTYYPSDAIEEKGQYRKGKKHGTWKYWRESGSLFLTEEYDHGILIEAK